MSSLLSSTIQKIWSEKENVMEKEHGQIESPNIARWPCGCWIELSTLLTGELRPMTRVLCSFHRSGDSLVAHLKKSGFPDEIKTIVDRYEQAKEAQP